MLGAFLVQVLRGRRQLAAQRRRLGFRSGGSEFGVAECGSGTEGDQAGEHGGDTTGEAEDGQIRHQSGDPEGQAHTSEQYSGQSSQSHVTPSAFLAASEAFLCIGPADPATLSDRTGRPAGASR